VQTDAILIARLAHEIGERFNRARLQDAGRLEDGRFALALWKKGATLLLCADVFAPTPAITVESGELPVAVEPGFVRAAVTSLRGTTLIAARARDGERIIELEFGSQSRFGVRESFVLIFELVPRFGNIILTKDGAVIAALKEFRAAGKTLRSVRPGNAYEPPPARPRRSSKALETEPDAATIRDGGLYVYRDAEGALLQAHVVPLREYAQAACERSASLLDLLSEVNAAAKQPASGSRETVRTAALRALDERERKLRADLARIEKHLSEGSVRDDWRVRGDAIYATLHDLPAPHRAAAKAEASALFARYKKAGTAQAHLARRKAQVQTALADLEELRWELERAEGERVGEVADLITKPRDTSRRPRAPRKRKSSPPQAVTPNGSRILLGRSPLENAELTFHVARPADLWFHARGQPGAHVILQRDDRAEPSDDDIRAAAQLAAFHSRGRTSSKITVDYTQRKHVRKRPDAAPGLVFYTNASSVVVEPRDSMNIASPKEKNR
jgi:predicted ribosome quality control (RQC) complex YloA/Tae2 family protein